MHSGLTHHLHSNKLIPEKHGFDKGMSTENPAFRVADSVFKSVNQIMHVGGIFCDLVQAYDSRYHEILVAELHFCSM
jgi:hypothetical protein